MRARLLVIAAVTATLAYSAPVIVWSLGSLFSGHVTDRMLITVFALFAVVGGAIGLLITMNVPRPYLMKWLVCLAVLTAVPVFLLGSFFVNALMHDTNGWHPAPTEAFILPATVFGAAILPAAALVLVAAARQSGCRTSMPKG